MKHCVCETLFILIIVHCLDVITCIYLLTNQQYITDCSQVQKSSVLNFALCYTNDVFVIFKSVAYGAVYSRFGRFAEVIRDVTSSFDQLD